MESIFKIIKKLSVERDIVVTIVKDHYSVLEKCLLYHGTIIKAEVVRLIGYLCIDEEITTFIVEIKTLENLLCELIKILRDSDTLCQIIVLTKIILEQTNQKFGKNALKTISSNVAHKPGELGIQAK